MIARFVAVALALAAPAHAADANARDPNIPFTRYTLGNGLTVILSEDHRLPLVALNVWYDASPANEPPGRSGFAHLFEHMMFKGSQHVGDDQHIKLLEENGVTLYNASTDWDQTNYFETLPSNRLELGLWLESDRMGFLVEALTQAKLDNQRDVVRNERCQSYDNRPYGASELALIEALFPPEHPYHGAIIGSHEDLQAATLDDVKAFHRKFYAPANATLCIAGDFEPTHARALVEKYFGPLPGGTRQPRRKAAVPSPKARRIVLRDAVSLPRVSVGWVTTPAFTDGDAELDLAARLLGGGRSSRLYRRLVHERQIASDVRCERQGLLLGSPFTCAVTAAAGHSAEEIEQALGVELARLRAEAPTAVELDRARNRQLAEADRHLEQLGGFGGKSDALQYYELYTGDPGHLAADLARYRAVTPAGLQAAVKRALGDQHRVTVVTLPRGGEAK